MATIATLDVLLRLNPADFQSGLDSVAKTAESAGRWASNLGRSLTTYVTAPLGLIAGLGVRSAQQLETFGSALGVLIGDAERAGAVFDDLYEFSAKSPFDWRSLSDGTRMLAAFGVEAEDIVPTLRRIGDISAGTGNNIAEVAELYGKARVQGTLFAEDINQLTGRGIPIIQELAAQFGVAESEVRGLVSQGKVGFPELEQAFVSLTAEGGKFFGMTETMADTSAGKLSQLKDSFEQVTDIVGALVLPVFDRIVVALQKITDWFVNLDEGTQNTIVVMGAVAAAVGPVLLILGKLLTSIASVVQALGVIAPVVGKVATALAGLNPVTVAVVAALAAVGAAVYQVVQHWDVLSFEATRLWEAVQAAFSGMAGAVISIVQGLVDAVGRVFTAGLDRVRGVVQAGTDAVRGIFEGLARVVVGNSIVPDMVDQVAAEFVRLRGEMEARTAEAANATVRAMELMEASVVQSSELAVAGTLTQFQRLPEMERIADVHTAAVMSSWDRMKLGLRTTMDDVFASVRGTWDRLAGAVKDPIGALTDLAPWKSWKDGLKGILGGVLGSLGGGGIFGKVAGIAGNLLTGGVSGVVTGAIGAVGGFVSKLFGGKKDDSAAKAQQAAAAAQQALASALQALTMALDTVTTEVRNAVSLLDNIRRWVEVGVNNGVNLPDRIAEAMGRVLSGIVPLLSESLGPALDAITAGLADLAEAMRAALDGIAQLLGSLGEQLHSLERTVANPRANLSPLPSFAGGGSGVNSELIHLHETVRKIERNTAGGAGGVNVQVHVHAGGGDLAGLRGAVSDGLVEGLDRALGRRSTLDTLQRGRVRFG